MTDHCKAYNEFIPHKKHIAQNHKLIQLSDIMAYLDIIYLDYDIELNIIVSLKNAITINKIINS
jgi:hypothetical protein